MCRASPPWARWRRPSRMSSTSRSPRSAIISEDRKRLLEASEDPRFGRFRTPWPRGPSRPCGRVRSSTAARLRHARRNREAGRKAGQLIEEASALALVGARERGVRVEFTIDPRSTRSSSTGSRYSRCSSTSPQRHGRDAGGAPHESSPSPSGLRARHGRGLRGRYRSRHLRRDRAKLFHPFVTSKAHGHGGRPVDRPHHRRTAWGPDYGRSPMTAEAPSSASRFRRRRRI